MEYLINFIKNSESSIQNKNAYYNLIYSSCLPRQMDTSHPSALCVFRLCDPCSF